MYFKEFLKLLAAILVVMSFIMPVAAQKDIKDKKKEKEQKVRTVTIPISIFTKQELKDAQAEEFIQAGDITVKENDEDQTILSIRSVTNTPIHLAVLIQDDLSSNVNLQLEEIKKFIKKLPADSRVMVAYLGSGATQIRQKFTTDLEKAAKSIRIVTSSSAAAPNSPYEGVEEISQKFDALPTGRRAILLVSDGFNASDNSPGAQSLELSKAILKAQRRSIAIYSFYSPATNTENAGSSTILSAQGSLNRLSQETGGRAFFQGTIAPISFEPFFKDLNLLLNRQFALTYLSTHPKKGYYKIQVTSTNPEIKIGHPKGYYYRGR